KLEREGAGGGNLRLARGQKGTVLVAKQVVDGHEVVEGLPVLGRILHTAGNEHRPRRHQGVQIDEILAGVDHLLVKAGARVRRRGYAGLALDFRIIAEIPRLPVIHVAVFFVEDNTRIGPDGTGKAFIQAGGEHRPFAAVGEPDDADAVGRYLGKLRESGEA